MPRPLSNDLRKRIIDAKLRGDTAGVIACEKEVNKSTIQNCGHFIEKQEAMKHGKIRTGVGRLYRHSN